MNNKNNEKMTINNNDNNNVSNFLNTRTGLSAVNTEHGNTIEILTYVSEYEPRGDVTFLKMFRNMAIYF